MPELVGSWGILGGVFDPVHRGHLTLASDVYVACDLEGVLFVPAYAPPHKEQQSASYENRCAMVLLAIATYPMFRASTVEKEMDAPSYSLNTVRELKSRFPAVQFSFIVGDDVPFELDNWHRPEELLQEVPLIVGSRSSEQPENANRFESKRISYIETSIVKLSSTEIRRRIHDGITPAELSGMVGEAVASYIEERRLYR
jgi:nicotinate-nucleotide adenylyltransferase